MFAILGFSEDLCGTFSIFVRISTCARVCEHSYFSMKLSHLQGAAFSTGMTGTGFKLRGRFIKAPVQCEKDDKFPIPCQDNSFGFSGCVISENISMPLRRCTPFLTNSRGQSSPRTSYENPVIHGDTVNMYTPPSHMLDGTGVEPSGQQSVPPQVLSHENTLPLQSRDSHTFTDGGSSEAMTVGGVGHYRSQQVESLLEEEDMNKYLKGKKKKAQTRRQKSHQILRKITH
ncbi:uncharacterized protein LOC113586530 isoform X2 [Electrophorus electricus]|uniref:uncharacterized protein LOC113586530 isoform X2 n=1 Tax=Electrophorus electricus TaxID=8005 RepID=UPI0015CF9EB1|nr:uncharacterized protein LOC113586530 isoform X2 [Electrophorus electricus]